MNTVFVYHLPRTSIDELVCHPVPAALAEQSRLLVEELCCTVAPPRHTAAIHV
jgi:hypothetical protein